MCTFSLSFPLHFPISFSSTFHSHHFPVSFIIAAVEDLFEPLVIPFSQSDMILGVGHRADQLFFFMRSHGLVTIASRVEAPARGGGKEKRKTGSSSVR